MPHVGELTIVRCSFVSQGQTDFSVQLSSPIALLVNAWILDQLSHQRRYSFEHFDNRKQAIGCRIVCWQTRKAVGNPRSKAFENPVCIACRNQFLRLLPKRQSRLVLLRQCSGVI
jgi:hypothetical protein